MVNQTPCKKDFVISFYNINLFSVMFWNLKANKHGVKHPSRLVINSVFYCPILIQIISGLHKKTIHVPTCGKHYWIVAFSQTFFIWIWKLFYSKKKNQQKSDSFFQKNIVNDLNVFTFLYLIILERKIIFM